MKKLVRGVSPRLLATGLLSSSANSAGVRITGVIPQDEPAVSLIPERIVEGTYLSNDKPSGVVIGAELARKLEVKIGSRVVLMTQALRQPGNETKNGAGEEMQSTLLRVSGIFRTGLQAVDANIIQLPLPAAQTLLGVPDGQVTQVAILLQQEGDSPMVARALRKQLTGEPVEVLTWRESIPMLAQILGLDHAFNYIMNGVVLAMVGLGILNTILMRVLERRYEFGVCKALGLKPTAACSDGRRRISGPHGDKSGFGTGVGFERRTLFRYLGIGSALDIQGGSSTRACFRSYSLLALKLESNRLVR